MKNFTLTLGVAAAALLTLPSLSLADDKPAGERGKRPGGPGGPGARVSPEERLKHMTETLGLSQEQQDKVKAIQEKNGPAMKEIFAKGRENLTEEDKTKMRELMKTQMEEIGAVLTPEQKEKWQAEMAKRRQGGPEGGPRRGGDRPGAKKPESK
jgi:Spy/CpxP family protein refolding chaperone